MKIYFVHNDSNSCNIRAIQTSQSLNKYFPSINIELINFGNIDDSIKNIHNSIIIASGNILYLFKGYDNLQIAKSQNNLLFYDIVDNFCWDYTNPLKNEDLKKELDLVDVFLHTNSYSKEKISLLFKDKNHFILPHQWDIRNEEFFYDKIRQIESDFFKNRISNKIGYFGSAEGCQISSNYIDFHARKGEFKDGHEDYNFHISFRKEDTDDFLFKPCTKLAVASSFMSVLLATKEKSVLDILGDDYSFYVNDDLEIKQKLDLLIESFEDKSTRIKILEKVIESGEELSPKKNAENYMELFKFFGAV